MNSIDEVVGRIVVGGIGCAAVAATIGTVSGAIGAAVLNNAGWAGFSSSLMAVRAGAAGCALVGGIVGAISRYAEDDDSGYSSIDDKEYTACHYIGLGAVGIGALTLSTMIGNALVDSVSTLTAGQAAAAASVGASVAIAGGIGFAGAAYGLFAAGRAICGECKPSSYTAHRFL